MCTQFEYGALGDVGAAGVYWQYPADNWGGGDVEGLAIPAGAKSIKFTAWSNVERQSVEFFSGISEAVDGYKVSSTVALTTMPTEYWLDLSGITYDKVIGGFGWYAAPSEVPFVLSIQDITWSTEEAPEIAIEEMPGAIAKRDDAAFELPYPLHAAFLPSGVMPMAAADAMTINGCSAEEARDLSHCVAFGITPNSAGWAGVYWHTMDMGWMGPAAALPDGIIGVSFYAWTDQAGLFRKFGVGDSGAGDVGSEVLGGVDGINGQQDVPMATEPTLYFIGLASSPPELIGGFF